MKIIGIISTILFLILCSCKSYEPESDSDIACQTEIDIYNELLDSLYSIRYCNIIMIEPDQYFSIGPDEVDSAKYYAYKERYEREIGEFYARLDTTEKIVFVIDTLSEISLLNEEEFIKSKLNPSDSAYVGLLSTFKPARAFHIDSLEQSNITIRSYSKYTTLYNPKYPGLSEPQFHFVDDEYWIGIISFSRLLIDRENDVGIFEFAYTGGGDCAYGGYYLINKINNRWLIHMRLITWVS